MLRLNRRAHCVFRLHEAVGHDRPQWVRDPNVIGNRVRVGGSRQLRSYGAPSSLAQSRQTLRFAGTARRSLQQDTKIAKQEIRVQISVEQRENSLLAALPDPEWQRWEPLLQPIDMPLGEVCTSPAPR